MPTFGFKAHVLDQKSLRIRFDSFVTDSALVPSSYSFSIISGPAVIPAIHGISYYDADHQSVEIVFEQSLTLNGIYSVSIVDVVDIDNNTVIGSAYNFTATVPDKPIATGSFLSKREHIDLLFDRSVGQYSTTATADISSGGPGVPMTQVPWFGASIPETTLRFALPVGMPAATDHTINFNGVTDSSLNSVNGSIPLTLLLRSPTPHSYATVTQAQIIDAFVADVSNNLINAATIRVYFNCPMKNSDVLNTLNWTVAQSGAHSRADTAGTILSPDAVDLPTLITLLNELKLKFNAHLSQPGVHVVDNVSYVVTAVDAIDLATSILLVNELNLAYLQHVSSLGVHLYDDTLNVISVGTATDLITSITVANQIKSEFSGHISADYPLSFSTAYPSPIGSISNFSSSSNAFNVEDAYTYFVDLHVVTPNHQPTMTVTTNIQSEDGLSTTNPAGYSGKIIARSGASPASVLSKLVSPDRSISIKFDREISLPTTEILDSSQISVGVTTSSISTSIASLMWALNDLIFAYSKHIEPPNVGHAVVDTTNLVVTGDFASANFLVILNSANSFKNKLNSHMSSSVFHFDQDLGISGISDATDYDSLVSLMHKLRDEFLRHNLSGSFLSPISGVIPMHPGHHTYPGPRVFSAKLFDKLTVEYDRMQSASQTLLVNIMDVTHDNFSDSDITHSTTFEEVFTGLVHKPYMASIMPEGSLYTSINGPVFRSNNLHVFFSKRMSLTELSSSSFIIVGPGVMMTNYSWLNDRVVSIVVVNTSAAVYTLEASGLFDQAGNPLAFS